VVSQGEPDDTAGGDVDDSDRYRQLATDLPAIWNDPATPMRERKRIARLLLTDVTVTRTTDLRVALHPS
jgi:hypothetical protein